METKNIYFISGIDTDAGKSYCTAWYARELMQRGLRVITQKFIQTGNTGHSEDIDLHRRLTGTGYLPEDKEGLTMPEIFSYPCSPHPSGSAEASEANRSDGNGKKDMDAQPPAILLQRIHNPVQ